MPDTSMRRTEDWSVRYRHREATRSQQPEREPGVDHGSPEGEPLRPAALEGSLQGSRGSAPVRSASMHEAQKLYGNRAAHRLVQRRSAETGGVPNADCVPGEVGVEVGWGSSAQLGATERTFLERGLGADLSGVRVHDDNSADRLARSVDALAFTTGQDIYFRSGAYKPESPEGLRLLAHEATHAVQQERAGLSSGEAAGVGNEQPGFSLSTRTDPSEVEAERAAERTMAGEPSDIRATPTASVSRFGWSDALAMGLGGVGGEIASAFAGPSPSEAGPGPTAAPGAAAAAPQPAKEEGVWDKLKSGWSGEQKREQKVGGEIDDFRREAIDGTVDWLEGQAKKGGQAGVEATNGIPVINELARANAAVTGFNADVMGGFVKGAGGFLGGLGQMVANPVGTAKGLWAMSTHIPGIGLPSKILDKGIDVATGDKKLGDAFDETLGAKAGTDDLNFWKGVGGNFIKPYGEAIDKGKYGEVGGRALFDVGSLVLGAGEAKAGTIAKAAEAGDAANAAAKVVDASEGANAAAKVVDVAEGANAAPKSVVPPSGVPTVRSPTPIVERPPGSVPPSPLVPEPGQILPPAPSTTPPTIPAPATEIPPAPATVVPRAPKTIPAGPPSGMPVPSEPPLTLPEFPSTPPVPAEAPPTVRNPSVAPPTNPAPSEVPPSTVPGQNLPPNDLPPGFLENPVIPKQPEPSGWAQGLLDEEAAEAELIRKMEELKKRNGGG